jgi:phage protein D
MSSLFDIIIGGTAAKDFDADIIELEVEENADLPGAFSITLPVALASGGDYDTVSDPRLAPLSNIAVTAQASDGQTHCLIDGYVLAQQIHLDTGTAKSTIKIWGQDASWLMNVTEQAKEWADVTDGAAANSIFATYGFTPDPSNLDDDSPAHTEDGATLMQRGSDAQFLRVLARRSGKLFRVFCTDTPGQRTGFFAAPNLSADPAITLVLNDAAAANVSAIDVSFDVMRPSAVSAFQALFTDTDADTTGAGGNFTDDGLPTMNDRGLATVAVDTVTALLTTTAADAATITQRANSVLREAGWFVRCQGTTDAELLGSILRAGTIVVLNDAGALHSGNYLVWSVRHRITAERHEMQFVLVRNALGTPPPAPPNGGLSL